MLIKAQEPDPDKDYCRSGSLLLNMRIHITHFKQLKSRCCGTKIISLRLFFEPDLFRSELVVGSKLTQIQIRLWGTHLSYNFCCRTFLGRGRIRIRNSKILDTNWIYSTKKSLSAVWSRSRNSSLSVRLRCQILSWLYQCYGAGAAWSRHF